MSTKPTTGIHGLDITLHGEAANAGTVDGILAELFNLSFTDFHSGTKTMASSRAYDCSYTHQNKIFLFVGGRTRNNSDTLHINIKGSAFDSGLADPERIRSWCQGHQVKATAMDIYNDDATGTIDYDRIWKQVEQHYFASRHVVSTYPGSTPGAPRTVYFGTGNRRLCIYEKGRLDPDSYPLEHVRLEMQLRHGDADQVFKRWLSGDDVGMLAAGLISQQVEFKDLRDKDRNNARRKACPYWLEYLAGVEKLKLQIEHHEPDPDKQLDAFGHSFRSRLIEHGPVVIADRVGLLAGVQK